MCSARGLLHCCACPHRIRCGIEQSVFPLTSHISFVRVGGKEASIAEVVIDHQLAITIYVIILTWHHFAFCFLKNPNIDL